MNFELRPWTSLKVKVVGQSTTLTVKLDLDIVKTTQYAKYPCQKSLCSNVVQKHRQTLTHIEPIALPGPLKWWAKFVTSLAVVNILFFDATTSWRIIKLKTDTCSRNLRGSDLLCRIWRPHLDWMSLLRSRFGCKYCGQRVFVCSVCLSVRPLAYLKNHTSNFYRMFCTCYTWPWLGPPLITMQYVMYFRFYGHCYLSHNGANGPEWKTARMFRPVRLVAALGAKSAVPDCILLTVAYGRRRLGQYR